MSSSEDDALVPKSTKSVSESPQVAKSVTKSTSKKPRKRVVWTEAHFEPINTWWEQPLKSKSDPHWTYLEHQGLMFHPVYTPHKVKMEYNGHPVELPPVSEEIANFWCAALTSNYAVKPRFIENFWTAFVKSLPPDHILLTGELENPECLVKFKEEDSSKTKKRKIQGWPLFENANFDKIAAYLNEVKEKEKETRKSKTKSERLEERQKKLESEGGYMYCLHDFIREKVAAYKAEVPGLFRGRGEHPKMGRLKRRILPDEVTLNLSEEAPVPKLPQWLRGHAWRDVYHDNSVTWLAFYRDTVAHAFKYVFLGASSAVKGSKDYMKYELARQLKSRIKFIRDDYTIKMNSNDLQERQLGTATYVIDALALRVGNEKDREEEADTVGCCSLRVEHLTNLNDEEYSITLDFLGKDSIRYLNTVKVSKLAYNNIKDFSNTKGPSDNIFDLITPGVLNKYLKELMAGLSAKVFRTYNASITLQQELKRASKASSEIFTNVERAKLFYEDANRTVAILCNHQRSVPKTHQTSMAKLEKQLTWLKEDIEECLAFSAAKSDPTEWEWDAASPRSEDDPARSSVVKANWKVEQAERHAERLQQRVISMELRMKLKDENKTVANNTSKQHYMDPRITVAFCKEFDLPIEKFFNATLLKKFPWAMFSKSDFEW